MNTNYIQAKYPGVKACIANMSFFAGFFAPPRAD